MLKQQLLRTSLKLASFALVGQGLLAEAKTPLIVRAFPALSFSQPLFLTAAPDNSNRLFVVEKTGAIKVFANDDAAAVAETFIDLSAVIGNFESELGLLGLAFSPDYATTGEFFVAYTAENPRRTVVARALVSTTNPNQADPATLETVIDIPKTDPTLANHNGGMIAFGADRMLYVGTGDGGGAGDPQRNAQNMSLLLGKILRLDVLSAKPYAVPADNPYVGVENHREEIWASGMRNPWRFSFDRDGGTLWLGDVGQDRVEEINLVAKGGNYGWNVYEGTLPFDNPDNLPVEHFSTPIFQYDRSAGSSITGGYVYRGATWPDHLGLYIYGDFMTGKVWSLLWTGTEVQTNVELGTVANLSSFGEDQGGEILMVSLQGSLWRFQFPAP